MLNRLFHSSPKTIRLVKATLIKGYQFRSRHRTKGSSPRSREKLLVFAFVIGINDNVFTLVSSDPSADGRHHDNSRDLTISILPFSGPQEVEITRILKCRTTDPAAVNFKLIQDWMNRCEREHKNCRGHHSDRRSLTEFSFRLIDVQKETLVCVPRRAKYLALSYV
jgi:hypothetical protein